MRKTPYFGYGSNLWREQMKSRCPNSTFLGIACLSEYEWIISERGYANVVPVDADEHVHGSSLATSKVWGLVYSLTADDESRLDRNEGVPKAYQKQYLDCDYWSEHALTCIDQKPIKKSLLVYISKDDPTKSKPKKEYIYRMNKGIKDAIEAGVPKSYINKVLRKYIPEVGDDKAEDIAKEQALQFEDEK